MFDHLTSSIVQSNFLNLLQDLNFFMLAALVVCEYMRVCCIVLCVVYVLFVQERNINMYLKHNQKTYNGLKSVF